MYLSTVPYRHSALTRRARRKRTKYALHNETGPGEGPKTYGHYNNRSFSYDMITKRNTAVSVGFYDYWGQKKNRSIFRPCRRVSRQKHLTRCGRVHRSGRVVRIIIIIVMFITRSAHSLAWCHRGRARVITFKRALETRTSKTTRQNTKQRLDSLRLGSWKRHASERIYYNRGDRMLTGPLASRTCNDASSFVTFVEHRFRSDPKRHRTQRSFYDDLALDLAPTSKYNAHECRRCDVETRSKRWLLNRPKWCRFWPSAEKIRVEFVARISDTETRWSIMSCTTRYTYYMIYTS